MNEGSLHLGVTKILEFILLTKVLVIKKYIGVSSPDVAIKIPEFEYSFSAKRH